GKTDARRYRSSGRYQPWREVTFHLDRDACRSDTQDGRDDRDPVARVGSEIRQSLVDVVVPDFGLGAELFVGEDRVQERRGFGGDALVCHDQAGGVAVDLLERGEDAVQIRYVDRGR